MMFTKMKSLSDLVPNREFVDVTDEIPGPDEPEFQQLPPGGVSPIPPECSCYSTPNHPFSWDFQ